MVCIKKKNEPNLLKVFRETTPMASYDSLAKGVKPAIKQSLLEEQGYICAYCMDRITMDSMRVEHWNPQHKRAGDDLDYLNMLGVCLGNKAEDENCDKHRGNLKINKQTLKYNPSNPAHYSMMKIKYLADGSIESGDIDFSNQLTDVLNLNAEEIKIYRQQIIDAINSYIENNQISRLRGNSKLKSLIQTWNALDNNGMHKPYFGVAIYWLESLVK